MKVAIGLSRKTVELIDKFIVIWKQAKLQALEVYRSALVDVLGDSWADKWQDADNELDDMEKALWFHMKAKGMSYKEWTRFRTYCRKTVLAGNPVEFGSTTWTREDCKRAAARLEELKLAYPDRDINDLLKQVRQEINQPKNQNHAEKTASKSNTLLRLPNDGEKADDYFEYLYSQICGHLQLDEVQKLIAVTPANNRISLFRLFV